MSERLAALGVAVLPAYSAANVAPEVDEVVAGNLARKDNAEVLEAVRRGLRVRSMPETLHDEILPGRHSVVIAGTHGKTTTTALAAWLLASAGREPGYLVGGEPANFPGPAALGTGAAFVVEGDEYSTSYADFGPKFLHYAPRTFVLTSVEFDHADLYADLAAVKAAFRAGVALVPPDGRIVANADDEGVREVVADARARLLLYGAAPRPPRAPDVDLLATQIAEGADGTRFTVHRSGREPFSVVSTLAGRHNVANALAAISVALEFGLSAAEIAAGLASFRGVKRRLEVLGTAAGVTVVDDFAHHPTAVASTLAGARRRFAPRRLWAAFEPRSMTAGRADFFEPYVAALSNADAVALAAPFHAARLAQPGGPGALDAVALVGRLRAAGTPALTAENPDALLRALLPELREGDVVVAMSSGAFGNLPRKLLAALLRR
jgi:UDP-N-acetylmuramate: L-alanyl-gamma-D-glutamyl-meso-diaminopimelate ligase